MKCPICKDSNLIPSFLEEMFHAHTCNNCSGNWLLVEDYVVWKDRHPDYAFSNDAAFEVENTKRTLLCPVSGKIMHKYKIAHDSGHKLDYSPSVGGVWLDKGEWEYLKEKNLAGSMNKVFTSQWQKSVREKSAEITFADLYQEKFGEESYAKVKEVRQWLNNHPCKIDLRAYILADDPYSAEK